nr:hypothetical protein CFP56_78517 [Quercus suber]
MTPLSIRSERYQAMACLRLVHSWQMLIQSMTWRSQASDWQLLGASNDLEDVRSLTTSDRLLFTSEAADVPALQILNDTRRLNLQHGSPLFEPKRSASPGSSTLLAPPDPAVASINPVAMPRDRSITLSADETRHATDLAESTYEPRSILPTVEGRIVVDLTGAIDEPTLELQYSKIKVVNAAPETAFRELRSQYSEIFVRTLGKLDPLEYRERRQILRDSSVLALSMNSPRALLNRHEEDWKKHLKAAEKILLKEYRERAEDPAYLKRAEESTHWSAYFKEPSRQRYSDFVKDAQYLQCLLKDLRTLKDRPR